LFLIVILKTLTFHKVVEWHTQGMVGSIVRVLLKIVSWFWQWKNFENRLIFGEVIGTQKWCHFGPPCTLVSGKNVPLCDCSYLNKILTDFQNSFTGTLCTWTSSSSVVIN